MRKTVKEKIMKFIVCGIGLSVVGLSITCFICKCAGIM